MNYATIAVSGEINHADVAATLRFEYSPQFLLSKLNKYIRYVNIIFSN